MEEKTNICITPDKLTKETETSTQSLSELAKAGENSLDNVDTSEIDLIQEKVDKLLKSLKEVNRLIHDLTGIDSTEFVKVSDLKKATQELKESAEEKTKAFYARLEE